MSKEHMLAALNLEMSGKVPRTEYSASGHWALIQAVTGIKVTADSDGAAKYRASRAFMAAWDYGMNWNVDLYREVFGDKFTDMGHAVYADGGGDFHQGGKKLIDDPEDVYRIDMDQLYGQCDVAAYARHFSERYASMCRLYPEQVNMTGIYITCISGILEMLGWDTLLMAAGVNPEAFGAFINRYCDWISRYFEALARSDAPVVMIHDDMVWGNGPFLHPDFYRRFIFPNYRRLFRPVLDAGKKLLYTCDGNYSAFIDDVADCGVHGFVMEPSTNMRHIAEKYGKTHVFVGNADTSILFSGSREAIENEVRRCMDIGKHCPGFVLAVGNHIPPNTPVENALIYNEAYEKMAVR